MQAAADATAREEHLRLANEAHRSLQQLLSGILEWSRTAMLPLEPRVLHLPKVLADPKTSAQWDFLLRERRARLEVDPDIPPVLATEALVTRVFGNLITNAIRHDPGASPRVRVYAARPSRPDRVAIVVEDTGPGFPSPLVARVERMKNRPSTIKGGFGLAIARRAVERLQGTLVLSNPASGGGRVVVELPSAQRVQDLEQRVRELV